jgi:hypothetical protein
VNTMIRSHGAVTSPFRRAPSRSFAGPSLAAAVHGPVPYNWLAPTGRLEQVLNAWGRGALAEVPTGTTFDVIRVPSTAAAPPAGTGAPGLGAHRACRARCGRSGSHHSARISAELVR